MRSILLAGLTLAVVTVPALAQQPSPAPGTSIAQRTTGLQRQEGSFRFTWMPRATAC